jgi:hypothetical protein
MEDLRRALAWPASAPDPTPLQSVLLQVLKAVRHDVAEENDEESATHAFFHTFFPLLTTLGRDYPPPLPTAPSLKGLRFKSLGGASPLSESATGADFAIAFFNGQDNSVRLAVFQAKLEKNGSIKIDQKNKRYRTRQLFDMVRLAVAGRRHSNADPVEWGDLDWVHYLGWRDSAWERVMPLSDAAKTIQRLHAKEIGDVSAQSPPYWRLDLDPRNCETFYSLLCRGASPIQHIGVPDTNVGGWLTVELDHAGTTWFPQLLGGLKTYFVCDATHEDAFGLWLEAWRLAGLLDDTPDSAPGPRTKVIEDTPRFAVQAARSLRDEILELELEHEQLTRPFDPTEIADHWTEVRMLAIAQGDRPRKRIAPGRSAPKASGP